MIISNRRRLYSSIITEDNGDIGINSEIMLDIYNSFDFPTDDISNIIYPTITLSLYQTSAGGNTFNSKTSSGDPSSFSIPVMKLSDKISRRFKYIPDKINSFLSASHVNLSNDGWDYTIDDPNKPVKFEKFGNDIYLTANFTAYSNYVDEVYISLEGDYFRQRHYSGTRSIPDNYAPATWYPTVWLDTIELQFTNLHITDNEFSSLSFDPPLNIVYTEKTYEGPIFVPSYTTNNGIEGETNEEYIKSITVGLPTGVSNNNYKILLKEFTIDTDISTNISIRNDALTVYCEGYAVEGGSCTVRDVKYTVISW